NAEPFEQIRPKLAGCSGSPAMAAPPRPSGVTINPQPTPQYGQVVRVADACCAGTCIGDRSVHVLLIAAVLLEFIDEGHRLVRRTQTERGDHVDESALDILGHVFSIAAHVDVGTFGKPGPEVPADFPHAVLYVDLVFRITRPCEREPCE